MTPGCEARANCWSNPAIAAALTGKDLPDGLPPFMLFNAPLRRRTHVAKAHLAVLIRQRPINWRFTTGRRLRNSRRWALPMPLTAMLEKPALPKSAYHLLTQ